MPRAALIASGLLHAALLIGVTVGLPDRAERLAPEPPAIEVTVVPAGGAEAPTPPAPEAAAAAPLPERAATRTSDAPPAPSPEPRPAPPPPAAEPFPALAEPSPEPASEPAPAEPEPAPEPPPPEATPAPPEVAAQAPPVPPAPRKPRRPRPVRVAERTPEPPPEAPEPETPAPETPAPADDFAALLKSVERLERRERADATRDGRGQASSPAAAPAGAARGLSAGEINAVESKIRSFWIRPAGLPGVETMRVGLRMQLGPDGSVLSADIIEDLARMAVDPAYRSVAEGARRAVFAASPLPLPPEKYARWRDAVMSFTPQG